MGLCKCPKRQVTNQFCFEHRVNVCEHCMVTSHPKCIVQSYLQWLKDSDYDSSCHLCRNPLEQEDCIRLICYHVFHWDCLNVREASLPANTAPSGHTCPTCSEPIFPPPNLISPIADVLRNRLGQVNWGRNELGLPLLSEDQDKENTNRAINHQLAYSSSPSSGVTQKNQSNSSSVAKPHSVLNIDSFSVANDFQASSRRPLLPRVSPIGGSDRDDNKYKKRTPAEIFSRWSRRFYAPSSRPPWRRTWFIVLSGVIIFGLIVYMMAILGRRQTSDYDEFMNAQDHL